MGSDNLLGVLGFEDEPGTEYGNVLPYAIGPDGKVRLAWPHLIRDTVQGLSHLAAGAAGEMTPGDNIPPEDTLALAGTAMGAGNALTGAAGAGGRLGMFIGQRAQNIDRSALNHAIGMENKPGLNPLEARRYYQLGRKKFGGQELTPAEVREYTRLDNAVPFTRADIFDATGWFKGKDGRWRMEIPDDAALLKKAPAGTKSGFNIADWYTSGRLDGKRWFQVPFDFSGKVKRTLPDFIDHPELFEQYPFLRDIEVKPTGIGDSLTGLKGYYDATNKAIGLTGGPEDEVRSTLLHEIQHAIQEHEDFARGGNTEMFLPRDFKPRMTFARDLRDEVHKELREKGYNPYTVEEVLKKVINGDLKEEDFSKFSKFDQDWITKLEHEPDLLERTAEALRQYLPLQQMQEQAYAKYRNIAGEAEARLTQDRMDYGAIDRAVNRPYENYDVPESEHIVIGLDGRPRRLIPVQGNPLSGGAASATNP